MTRQCRPHKQIYLHHHCQNIEFVKISETTAAHATFFGHGVCGEVGDCECDKNYFDGPNGGCSQTCPVADNGKYVVVMVFVKKLQGFPCACEYGWRGTNCDLPCPGMETTNLPCSGHGQCLVDYTGTPSTSCNCNQKFRGLACEISALVRLWLFRTRNLR